jgi:hypothetical protein
MAEKREKGKSGQTGELSWKPRAADSTPTWLDLYPDEGKPEKLPFDWLSFQAALQQGKVAIEEYVRTHKPGETTKEAR